MSTQDNMMWQMGISWCCERNAHFVSQTNCNCLHSLSYSYSCFSITFVQKYMFLHDLHQGNVKFRMTCVQKYRLCDSSYYVFVRCPVSYDSCARISSVKFVLLCFRTTWSSFVRHVCKNIFWPTHPTMFLYDRFKISDVRIKITYDRVKITHDRTKVTYDSSSGLMYSKNVAVH